VHDGERPIPSIEVLRNSNETARTAKAVIPVIPVVETVRHIICSGLQDSQDSFSKTSEKVLKSCSPCKKTSVTVPRDEYRLVQTPQTFDIQLLKAANKQPYYDNFTDDASVVEAFGYDVTLVEGNRENIKITTPYDLKIAEILI
jgi:2-C-methyl-D-erythritol 4-phosphate cytidylyltransferase